MSSLCSSFLRKSLSTDETLPSKFSELIEHTCNNSKADSLFYQKKMCIFVAIKDKLTRI